MQQEELDFRSKEQFNYKCTNNKKLCGIYTFHGIEFFVVRHTWLENSLSPHSTIDTATATLVVTAYCYSCWGLNY